MPEYTIADLSLENLRKIDDVAEDFEDALADGRTCSIENLLTTVPLELHSKLLAHLLELQLEHSVRSGQPAEVSDFLARFPNDADIVHRVFEAAKTSLPRMIGPYRLLREIGVGGMGVVYEGIQTKLNRQVALKVIGDRHAVQSEAVARFEREMRAVGSVQHPNIVNAMDAGEIGGTLYLAMEYLDGADAGQLCRLHSDGVTCSQLPVPDACEIVRQAALGLQHAHENGLIHRDVKPSNLFVELSGAVKLLDLGLARIDADESAEASLTDSGQVMGTVDYMAPEQGRTSSTVDARTDIYCLGATLYKLLTGRKPLSTDEPQSVMEKLSILATRSFPSVAEQNPNLPADLTQLCDQMMAAHPSDRPDSAATVAERLTPFCAGQNLRQLFVSPAEECVDTATIAERTLPEILPQQESKNNRAGSRWRVLIAAAGAAVTAAAIIFRLMTDGGEIRIVCHDPELEIEVVRNQSDVRKFAVGQLESWHWVKSGDYEIRIPQEVSDTLRVVDGEFTLTRNDQVTVEILRVMEANLQPEAPPAEKTIEAAGPMLTIGEVSGNLLRHIRVRDGGGTFDQLRDLECDNFENSKWSLTDDTLEVSHSIDIDVAAVCQIPVVVSGEYELHVALITHDINCPVFVTVPVADRLVSFLLPFPDSDGLVKARLDYVNLKPAIFDKPSGLTEGRPLRFVMTVANTSKTTTITARTDDVELGQWTGRIDQLTETQGGLEHLLRNRFAVGCYPGGRVTFHNVSLKLISGQARALRPETTTEE